MSLSGISGRSKGGEWKNVLYFDPRADLTEDKGYLISDEELRNRLTHLEGANEKIDQVFIYTNPIFSLQITQIMIYHAFIIFKTKSWWWSIEKYTDGITIQRSKKLESVRDFCRRIKRTTGIRSVELHTTAIGKGTVNDVFFYLWRKNELNKPYQITKQNCQDFANVIFNGTNNEDKRHVLSKGTNAGAGDITTNDVYFDPNADLPSKFNLHAYIMTPEQLFLDMEGPSKDTIQLIEVFFFPTNSYQLFIGLMYHCYIIIKTNKNHFWSFERNKNIITIQGANDKTVLVNTLMRGDRPHNILTPITKYKTAHGKGAILDLLEFIWKGDRLNQDHHTIKNNSKHFAHAIYREFRAKGDTW